MIYTKRTTKPPAFMSSSIFKKMKTGLRSFYKDPESKRRQQKPPYIPLPSSVLEKIRFVLGKEFNHRCAYCEAPITTIYLGDFDHFRPKSSARGLAEEFSLDHYWTLAFDWRNMYLCCQVCNKYKANWFPVEGKRSALNSPFNVLVKKENNLLIDPCLDDPTLHLQFEKDGSVKPLSKKGEITIDILKLNRKALLEARHLALTEFSESLEFLRQASNKKTQQAPTADEYPSLEFILEMIRQFTLPNPDMQHPGAQLSYFIKSIKSNPVLAEYISRHDKIKLLDKFLKKYRLKTIKEKKTTTFAKVEEGKLTRLPNLLKTYAHKEGIKSLAIESIEIKNFKSIEDLKIKFPVSRSKNESWLVLLGENGVGKSSFLQAVTLALMGKEYIKKLKIDAGDIYRNGATGEGLVRINQIGRDPIEFRFDKKSFRHNTISSPSYVLAYGSTRLFPTKRIKPERSKGKVRARNMFEPDFALFAEDWLLKLYQQNKAQFDFACRALKDMLAKELEDDHVTFSVRNSEVWLSYSDKMRKPDRLRQLSDGYKSIIALSCDMMQLLMSGKTTMETAEGTVLIDEIGTHLHPRWKMRVVSSFRAAFPKIQFIVTTHDPLCLKGLRTGEVVVLDKDQYGKIFSNANLPNPGEYTAEQLLSSKFFGLLSTIDDELERNFNEYYRLLGKSELSQRENVKLEKLKEFLRGKNHMGDDLREELALTAADKILAESRNSVEKKELHVLQNDTITLLKDLWTKPIDEQKKND